MNIKRHVILVLIFLVLVSLSAVSAADDAASDIVSADNEGLILDESIDEDASCANDNYDNKLILDDNDYDGLVDTEKAKTALAEGETTTGSFTDLYNDIIGKSEVTLGRDYKFNGTEVDDSEYINGIKITDAVTIDGDGHTIDGNHLARIFIANNDTVYKNINFINGNAAGNTGAIAYGTAYNCNFTNNSATHSGGAIYNGTAYNCNFTSNTADSGGAIFRGTAYNCNFTNNTAERSGGAMRESTAYNCNFTNNTADSGGAIYKGTAYNCNFTSNTAEYSGGAIYETTAYDCNFSSNRANQWGGAIRGGTACDCSFTGNTAGQGGEMHGGTAVLCTFENNDCFHTTINWPSFNITEFITSAKSGEKLFFNMIYGDYAFTGLNSTLKVYLDSEVIAEYPSFSGDVDGCAISLPAGIYKGNLTLVDYPEVKGEITIKITDGTTFWDLNRTINNNSESEISLEGDYKYNPAVDSAFVDGVVIDRNVTIEGNGHTIDGNNSARIFYANDNAVFKNINFINGNNSGVGGAIFKGTAYNCNFTDNYAGVEGGAIFQGTAYNCSFTGNTADVGGAMYMGTAYNCSFTGNTADVGGAMYRGTAYNCNFTSNTAEDSGGAMKDSTAYNCNFTSNTANNGGAMYESTAYNCNFTSNRANQWGGAIRSGTAYNCSFTGNTANWGETMSWATAVLCTFENNDCYETTFAPFFDISEFITTVDSDEKLFFNLTYDGQVYTGLNTTMVVSNGVTATFVGDSEGYDIDLPLGIYKASLTLTDYPEVKGEITIKVTDGTTFYDLNRTINNNSDSLIVLDRNYTYNEIFDGAFKDGVVISRALTVDGNGSTIDGLDTARIFNVNAVDVELSNISFKNGNSSKYGGAVYFFNGGSVVNCSFVDNHANIGGAVYVYEGDCAVYNSSFVNNSAGNSSAVHLSFDDSEVHGCIFVNNTAENGVVGQSWNSYKSINITDNIFLNNNGNNAIDFTNQGTFDVGNNWFGSTAENYTVKPYLNVNTWLFLNGTADPNPVDIISTSDIIFKLSSYNIKVGINDTYDNSNLPIVNLSITKTNGDIKDSALLGEKIAFTPISLGAATVTATIENLECTIELDINKANTELTAADVSTSYNVAKNLVITLKDSHRNPIKDAPINVELNGATITNNTDSNGQISIPTSGLNANVYDVEITYAGNGTYNKTSTNAKISISKAETKITPKKDHIDLFVGDEFKAEYTLDPADATGDISFKSSNSSVITVDTTGAIKAIAEGTATITISLTSDNYDAPNATVTVTVSKKATELSAEDIATTYKVNKNLVITLKDSNGNPIEGAPINVELNGKTITNNTDSNGQISIPTSSLNVNVYDVEITYAGNGTYNKTSTNAKITVNKAETKITPKKDQIDLIVGDESKVEYALNPADATGDISFKSSNSSVITVDTTGAIKAIAEGTATITVSLTSDNYEASDANVTVTVSKKATELSAEDIATTYKVNKNLVITLKDSNGNPIEGAPINVELNGETITNNTDSNGQISIPTSGLNAKVYDVEIRYAGDGTYKKASANAKITINKAEAKLTPKKDQIDLFVGDGSKAEYTLNPSDAAGDITFKSSNAGVVTVDKTGVIKATGEGTATITISLANDNYEASDASVNVAVSKKATSLTSSAVTTSYNVAKNLVITLKDADANPISDATVTVDLNGAKNYTTDKNGQIKVAVGKLLPKTYTANIGFAGDDIFNVSSTTAKVTVKKASPKLAASAKTFKFEDKTKKYTVTLKDNKGNVLKNKKVTLKVNGKTYTATTNSKGVATFKLTKLTKKGTFTAVVTYAGDKYYSKVVKKPKITVKAPAWKTISKGSKNKAMVKKIQKALKNNGYYLSYKGRYLKIDGIFSKYTEMAVKQFQKAKKLKVTGKVDYSTAKKLKLI